jgi:hypothetical protein
MPENVMKPHLRPISIYNFTALLILYVLVSAIVHLSNSNTIPNFLAYTILIFPIQIIFCIVFIIASISSSPRKTLVHYDLKALGRVLIAQAGVLLMAPTECPGWKAGKLCASMLETIVNLRLPASVRLDYIFYGFVVAYLVTTIAFFKDTQIGKPSKKETPQ